MRRLIRWKWLDREEGQAILWLAVGVPLLILFAAFSIDMGIIYQSRAKLSNAVDAAVLTAAKNYPQGKTTAQTMGTNMFVANYGNSLPALAWTWCPGTDPACGTDLSATLRATAPVNTTFMAYLPRWAQWTIADVGQATRSNLVMTLVLDRSGSMTSNQGQGALQAAVPIFVDYFLDGTDNLSMVSFGDNAKIDVAMTTTFASAIKTAVANMNFNGATFGTGAGNTSHDAVHGPPLNLADDQNISVTMPPGQPETKVLVYFTDGLMNTIQDTFTCTNLTPQKTLYNYGGYDSGSAFDFFDPAIDTWQAGDLSRLYEDSTKTIDGINGTGCGPNNPNNQSGYYCAKSIPFNSAKACKGPTQFPSQFAGTNKDFTLADVTKDAKFRARYTAQQMRTETIPTYIYVIGLGTGVAADPCTEANLATMANDPDADPATGKYPCASYPGVYISTQAQGAFLLVPDCPTSQTKCTSELEEAFNIIAAKVLLRLTQ